MSSLSRAAVVCLLVLVAASPLLAAGKPGKGDTLVDLDLVTLDGKPVKLLELTKDKVVVFKFGATWCGWCTRQIPALNELRKKYPKDVVAVLDIDVGEPAAKVEAHRKKHDVTFDTVLDPRGKAAGLYNVTGIPVTIVAGHDGTIVYRGNYTSTSRLLKAVSPAVGKLQEERKKK